MSTKDEDEEKEDRNNNINTDRRIKDFILFSLHMWRRFFLWIKYITWMEIAIRYIKTRVIEIKNWIFLSGFMWLQIHIGLDERNWMRVIFLYEIENGFWWELIPRFLNINWLFVGFSNSKENFKKLFKTKSNKNLLQFWALT